MSARANKRASQPNPSSDLDIGDLTPDPKNARKHGERNIGAIVDSLRECGAARSGVIDEDGVILAGNGVVEAAKKAGITKVRVVDVAGDELVMVRRTGLTPKQKTRLALFDNFASTLGEWDPGTLGAMDADELAGLFTDEELSEVLGVAPEFKEFDESAADEVKNVTCPECGHTFPK